MKHQSRVSWRMGSRGGGGGVVPKHHFLIPDGVLHLLQLGVLAFLEVLLPGKISQPGQQALLLLFRLVLPPRRVLCPRPPLHLSCRHAANSSAAVAACPLGSDSWCEGIIVVDPDGLDGDRLQGLWSLCHRSRRGGAGGWNRGAPGQCPPPDLLWGCATPQVCGSSRHRGPSGGPRTPPSPADPAPSPLPPASQHWPPHPLHHTSTFGGHAAPHRLQHRPFQCGKLQLASQQTLQAVRLRVCQEQSTFAAATCIACRLRLLLCLRLPQQSPGSSSHARLLRCPIRTGSSSVASAASSCCFLRSCFAAFRSALEGSWAVVGGGGASAAVLASSSSDNSSKEYCLRVLFRRFHFSTPSTFCHVNVLLRSLWSVHASPTGAQASPGVRRQTDRRAPVFTSCGHRCLFLLFVC